MSKKIPRPISPLYSRYLTSEEKSSLRATPVDDLSGEINLVRVISGHFMQLQQSAPQDIQSQMQILRTTIVLGEQFAKLIHAHNSMHDPLAETQAQIYQALEELRIELGI